MQKVYNCDSCDAEFKIKHTLDEAYYEVMFCPFCAAQIDEQEEDDEDDYDPRFTHEYVSFNFKTVEFTAALGISQVKKADGIFKKRQENVKKRVRASR